MDSLSSQVQTYSPKYLIFDFDQTIAKLDMDWSGWAHGIATILRSFASDGEQIDEKNVNYIVQAKFIQKYGTNLADELKKFESEYQYAHYRGVIPNADVISIIHSSPVPKFIWTSNPKNVIDRVLAELHLSNEFQKIATRDDVVFTKPNPEGFQLLSTNLSQAPTDWLMIGDSIFDQEAAKNAGIGFVRII
ncbi:MAG: HAD-superfamily hydrolase, subfamily IA, variant 1 [Microgenomates group bacterium GW2011_GWF2_45_18]|nr:MAG: HAD-superfamily hydrolase, subfamily IA, variant 1 [Microgenomates group bacterium GW2011_GWF1_44_10]KKU01944.1 MAG: HAD-superfamily hydrolase, subfamily IA, variant 1 [Microgenomates group bacterium GW2011_GWF2_45_18]OGJ41469.1 MAG: hypothetical protein A2378_00075 [Candidatus Pacebacteria bacterium RIFOXYB1_FULL_44_10]HAU98743.1 hypothetical protein [Candidatus Paceibacterota bacterium]HAX01437.1 hypothetical protein [Candidatus Paceibacterota bacterium]